MKYELLVKMADNTLSDPDKDKLSFKQYDIVKIVEVAKSKTIWDQLIAKNNCTAQQYSDAEIFPGQFKYPWSAGDMRGNQVFVLDEALTEQELLDFQGPDQTQTGLDGDGLPLYDLNARREYCVNIDLVTYYSNTTGEREFLSSGSKSPMVDTSIVVLPRYDKPILKYEIISKG